MNNRNTHTIITILILISFIFSSCSDVFIEQSDEELLTYGSWKVESVVTEPLIPLEDTGVAVSFEENCPHDEVLNFNHDGTYYISKNFNLCEGSNSDPVLLSGTWQITEKASKKVIDFITEESNSTYALQSISRSSLVLKEEWLKTGNTKITTYQNTKFEK